jgi:hypothetical protein
MLVGVCNATPPIQRVRESFLLNYVEITFSIYSCEMSIVSLFYNHFLYSLTNHVGIIFFTEII